MARYIDANVLKEKILKERDAIPLARVERYGFGVKTPNREGQAMRGGIRKALRCLEQTPTADVAPKSEVDELIYKLECFLCHVTGGRLSKHTYDLETMETVATDCINETYNDGYGEGYKECAREIFEEIEQEIKLALESNYKVRRDAEGDNDGLVIYVDGKIHCLRGIDDFIAELKKKYTEESQ